MVTDLYKTYVCILILNLISNVRWLGQKQIPSGEMKRQDSGLTHAKMHGLFDCMVMCID